MKVKPSSNLSNIVNPLSSSAGIALFGLAAARPALVKVSPGVCAAKQRRI